MNSNDLGSTAPGEADATDGLARERTGRVSRRLAAIWFADIVGFTRLASRDEATALSLVELFQDIAREEIERHGGNLVQFIGDGAFAYFASTTTAIRAALSLRNAFRDRTTSEGTPSQLRIGVHVGDVTVYPNGDVYGDGVNIASRLQKEARPGRVVVSEDIWRQCRQRTEFRFISLGSRQLEGITEPVVAYEIALTDEVEGSDTGSSTPEAERNRIQDARSLAVLPFENLSESQEAKSLAAGLHDDLVTELSKVPGLTVISRTSVRVYRGTAKSMPQIARELNVATIIEGAVQSAGGRVRLNVQLIDARKDVHRWAESFDRELNTETIFAMQSELTRRIVESLRAELTINQRNAVDAPPTRDLEAYRLYAHGRMRFDQRTEAGMRRALDYFERATERDPEYALAWAGLADALLMLQAYGHEDAAGILSRAEDAVRRALELDPNLAEAHASLGLLHSTRQEGPAAIRELKRAIELQPGYAEAHNWLTWMHLLLGNRSQTLESARRAVELNPLSPEAVSHLSLSYMLNGEGDKALAEASRGRELQSSWSTGRFYEGLVLYHLARFTEAVSILRDLSVPWAGSGPQATLALAHAASGDIAAAREVLTLIEESADPFAAGLIQAALGEKEEAFAAFEIVDRLDLWPTLALRQFYGPVWEPLKEDPRYQELLRKLNRSWGVETADTISSQG